MMFTIVGKKKDLILMIYRKGADRPAERRKSFGSWKSLSRIAPSRPSTAYSPEGVVSCTPPPNKQYP